MMWWFKSRRGHTVVPVAIMAFTMMVMTFLDKVAFLPTLVGSSQVLLMLFAPLPLCAAVVTVMSSGTADVDLAAHRRMEALDSALIVGITVIGIVIGYVIHAVLGSAAAASAGRNAALLVGVMLLAWPVLSQRSAALPAAWVMAVVVFGRTPAGGYEWWTVLPEPPQHALANLSAFVLFVTGLLMTQHSRLRERNHGT